MVVYAPDILARAGGIRYPVGMFAYDPAGFAGAGGLLTWTFCNRGQAWLALNWWRHMAAVCPDARPHVVCLDDEAFALLAGHGVPVNRFRGEHAVAREAVAFRSSTDWPRLTVMKVLIVHDLLGRGLPVFYSDTDVVARGDPRPLVLKGLEDAALAIQVNHMGTLCSGIFAAMPSPGAVRLFDPAAPGLPAFDPDDPGCDDQTFLHDRLEAMGDGPAWRFLPRRAFPNGAVWYANRAALARQAVMVHYNCVVGTPAKVAEMRHDGAWCVPEADAGA